MGNQYLAQGLIIGTLIFLLAPASIIIFILAYNSRKRKFFEEKIQMKEAFETELLKAQWEVKEETLQTLGADLHDNIGQLLSLTSLTLRSINGEDNEKKEEKIQTAIEVNSHAIREMRILGKLLQGNQILSSSLDEAIQYQIDWMEKSEQFKITYKKNGELSVRIDQNKKLIVFRIIQELLTNIIKHAKAKIIEVNLNYGLHKMEISITDNGIGFNQTNIWEEKRGMGLINIQKRAEILGGILLIQSEIGKGTSVQISIPYT